MSGGPGPKELVHMMVILDKVWNGGMGSDPDENPETPKVTSANSHDEANEEQTSRYKCDICYKLFARKKACIEHHALHKKTKEIECGICSRVFKTRSGFGNHLRTAHKDVQRYKCEVCKKFFATYPAFIGHRWLMSHYP